MKYLNPEAHCSQWFRALQNYARTSNLWCAGLAA